MQAGALSASILIDRCGVWYALGRFLGALGPAWGLWGPPWALWGAAGALWALPGALWGPLGFRVVGFKGRWKALWGPVGAIRV